jgi:hypothetical protein
MNETASDRIPNGAAWAAILAAGIGCAALALCIDLAEACKPISNLLNFYDPVGNLSGKSSVGVAVWLIAWAILHAMWRNRNLPATKMIAAITLILIVLSVIASCPLFFGLFTAA